MKDNTESPASSPAPMKAGTKQVLLFQAGYYFATGIWPLLHMESFILITGPKQDLWLVRTVALLITVISISLLSGQLRRRPSVETSTLAFGSALSLIVIDVWYVLGGVISPIYLLDALVEAVIVAALLRAIVNQTSSERPQNNGGGSQKEAYEKV